MRSQDTSSGYYQFLMYGYRASWPVVHKKPCRIGPELCELPRNPIPRTSVHKGIEKGRVPLQKHCDRCGCRESYLGSNQKLHMPLSQVLKLPQQSLLVVQPV
jgi:hypothetical protein